ncbi:MAG: hypothetical protein ACFFB2_04785 [Promethearchaeota archaeon]
MTKLKIIFLILSLLLLGGSTTLIITPLGSTTSFTQINSKIPPLRGGHDIIESSKIQSPILSPFLSIQFFPEPTFEVLQFSDHEMDLRGYGNDTVRFNMQFRPTSDRAWYYGYAQLWTSDTTTPISREAYWEAWVDPNTITIASFDISGYEILESGVNGPYSVRLRFYKDNGTSTLIYNNIFVHTTQFYSYTEFQPRPTIDSYTYSAIDTDFNGLYDWIEVYVTVTVSIPTNYYFSGTISGGGISEDARNNTYVSGTQIITLRFATWDFQSMSGSNTVSLTSFFMEHDTSPRYFIYSGNPSVSLGLYAASDFDESPFKPTGRFWERGYDTDADGFYNYYRFTIEINKTRIEEGEFRLYATLYQPPSSSITGVWDNYVSSLSLNTIGLVNASFDFNGIEIYKSGIVDTNFLVKNIQGYYQHRPNIGWNWDDWVYFSSVELYTVTYYNYTDFEGPGAALTHNFNDYGFDTDNDGLYNYIIVEVEIDVFIDGEYYLSSWLDISSTYQDIDYASTSIYLTVGIHWVQLQYDGIEFFRQAVNDYVKFEYLTLQGGSPSTELDYNNTAILSYYVFTQFDPPKARFTGIYSDTTADTNSDGIWDELRISVEVEINETGRYQVHGSLRNPITGDGVGVDSEAMDVLLVGTVSFVLPFPGDWIWRQHINTTYLLDYVSISEVDDNDNQIYTWDSKGTPFTTDFVYNSAEFIAPVAFFTGNFYEALFDSDLDTLNDFLVIGVEVEVSQTIDLSIEGYIELENTIWAYTYAYNLSPGTHWIEIKFVSYQLYKTFVNRIYSINFYLYRTDFWDQLDYYHDYVTDSYDYTEFDPPPAEFTDNFFDYGVDSDVPGNGKFDYVELAFEVIVVETGMYRIFGGVYADEGGESYYFSTDWETLTPGTHNITATIEPYWFLGHSSGTSAYVSYVDLIEYREIDSIGYDLNLDYNRENRPLTNTYNHNEFDPPPIAFTDAIFDYGVDSDVPSNGKFDVLELAIEVNVTEAGTYYLYGRVYCESGGDSFYFSSDFLDLPVGLFNFTFQMDAGWIRGHADGSQYYISYMHLYQYIPSEGEILRDRVEQSQYFSRLYYHHEFDIPDAWIIGILTNYPLDFDYDGYYDAYRIIFQVNVTVHNFDLHIYAVITEQETYNWIASSYIDLYDLTIGIHNISIDFRGDEIYDSGFTNGMQIDWYELYRISDWVMIDSSDREIPLTILYDYTDFNSKFYKLIRVYSINVQENEYEELVVNVTILREGTESILSVEIETEFGWYGMSRIYIGGNYEIWTFTYTPSSLETYTFTVYVEGDRGSDDSKTYQVGIPEIRVFTMNTSLPVTLGGAIHFETVVRDPDGIADVTLVTFETSYPMLFIKSSSMGEIWAVDVTFNVAGQSSAYILATDMIGGTAQSDSLIIIVNEGSEIDYVTIYPGTTIEANTEISFEIGIQKSDAIITSVTLEIIDDRGNDYLVPLEMTDETDELEIYGGQFTPERSGLYECTIRVLNTRNQESVYAVTITVRGNEDIEMITLGFEVLLGIGILVLFSIRRRFLKKQR